MFCNTKNSLFVGLCVTFLLASCNQQEFYEKEFLDGAAIDKPSTELPSGEVSNPDSGDGDSSTTNPDNGGGDNTTTNPDNGGGDNGSTDPDDGGDNTTTDPDNGGGDNGTTDPDDGGDNSTTDPDEGEDDGQDNSGPSYDTITNNFVQNIEEQGKVDILWVVDDSGSMSDEQNSLARNFEMFIGEFIQKDVDFKMAITTTDATSRQNGKWNCNPDLLDKQSADKSESKFIRDFQRCIKVGTRGSGYEKGLHTAESFFNRYETPSNKTFLREDAFLVIVFVSDEEDQSKKASDDYLNFYRSLKKDEGKLKVFSIVTKEKVNRWETVGNRYLNVSEKTGGSTADIKEDFYYVLRDMGGKIVDLLDKFALARIPATSDIEVKVNGTIQTEGYELDQQTGSVSFLSGYVPEQGAQIEITYKVLKEN